MKHYPPEIWHRIAGVLSPSSLHSFMQTHHYAKNSVTKDQIDHMKLWDSVFKDYSWVDEVTSSGSMPVLFRQNKKKPHIYLFLTKTNGGKARKPALLGLIKKSLRSEKQGDKPYEIDFKEFTLNISNIMWPDMFIMTPGLEWFLKNEKIEVALYENGRYNVKPKVFGTGMACVEVPNFKSVAAFLDKDPCLNIYPVYGSEGWPGL